jgi:hypothetical protein
VASLFRDEKAGGILTDKGERATRPGGDQQGRPFSPDGEEGKIGGGTWTREARQQLSRLAD